MQYLDDTTTLENTDLEEDKTQLLSGDKRLEYFGGNTSLLDPAPTRRQPLLRYLLSLIR